MVQKPGDVARHLPLIELDRGQAVDAHEERAKAQEREGGAGVVIAATKNGSEETEVVAKASGEGPTQAAAETTDATNEAQRAEELIADTEKILAGA